MTRTRTTPHRPTISTLQAGDMPPAPGATFRIRTLHTSATTAPYLTGWWLTPGQDPPDTRCALHLRLTPAGQCVAVACEADDPSVPGGRTLVAHWPALPAWAVTHALAPVIAAHPYTGHEHRTRARQGENRLLRAALALILTR